VRGWLRRALGFTSPSGRGRICAANPGEGSALTVWRIRPSSGASRHLLPEGEGEPSATRRLPPLIAIAALALGPAPAAAEPAHSSAYDAFGGMLLERILRESALAHPPILPAQADATGDADAADDPQTAEWKRRMAEVGELYEAADYAAAAAKAEEALSFAESAFGRDHSNTLISVSWLGFVYRAQGRYDEAEPLFLRALEASERVLGKEHPSTLASVNNLALLYRAQGRYGEAEPLFLRALEASERVLGKEHPDTLTAVNNLALLYQAQGRYAEAEPLFLRALEASERVLGKEHPSTLTSVSHLAGLYASQGRYAEAEPLYLRAIEASERVLGKEHPYTLFSVNNLALLYRAQGRYAEAEPLLKRALDALERVLGKEHPSTLTSVNNLASLYESQRRYAEAEPLYLRALEASERVPGKEHPSTLASVNNLALLYVAQGRYGEAEPLFLRALEAFERVLGKEHPSTLLSLQNYFYWRAGAVGAGLQSRWPGDAPALRLLRENLAAFDGYLASGANPARLADPTSVESRAARMVSAFERARAAGVAGSDAEGLREPVFSIIQRFNASAAAKALAASAERLAVGDEDRRLLLEERGRARASLRAKLASLDALRRLPQRNPEAEAQVQAEIAPIERRLSEIDNALVEGGAGSAELLGAARTAANSFVAKRTAQALLREDEALLVYSSVGGNYFAFVKKQRLSTTVSLDLARADIEKQVTELRKGLRLPFRMEGGKEVPSSDPRDLPTFDLDLAAKLNAELIGPLKRHLGGVRKLIIVADGPLQSLPFAVLVEQPGDASQARFERYRLSRFLVDSYAVSVQPSVSALQTLRARTPRSAGERPLLGFADPVLKPRAALAGEEVRIGKTDKKKAVIIPMSGAVDAKSLEDLPALPQTRSLLVTVGQAFSADSRDLFLGEDAQEADIRFLNEQGRLKRYRMIVFASHALVSNEIAAIDLIEPALVMSLPPVAPGAERPWENDGLLRASDIVGFEMDADLVILAACNTAAPDGTPGAEPLSGLAKAFMLKGARALLVSHWQADANSSAILIPEMTRLAAEAGFSEGLARAQRLLRGGATTPETGHLSHPALWGAFALIGDPGR